jgi:hypothetical protein
MFSGMKKAPEQPKFQATALGMTVAPAAWVPVAAVAMVGSQDVAKGVAFVWTRVDEPARADRVAFAEPPGRITLGARARRCQAAKGTAALERVRSDPRTGGAIVRGRA